MTPHQYWVAIGKGMERPYTGKYWFVIKTNKFKELRGGDIPVCSL